MSIVKIRAALETAIKALGELLPEVAISSSMAGQSAIFTTVVPHKLKNGVSITISGHTGSTPALDGTYFVGVLTPTTFRLLHKVTEAAIASTAGGVGGVCKPNLTAWDNVAFKPVPGVPYQKVNILFADTDNPTMGDNHYREVGFMQVSLYYPTEMGTFDINTRVDLIKNAFKRGSSFQKDDIVVRVMKTPSILTGMPIDESYAIPVRIFFQADVFA